VILAAAFVREWAGKDGSMVRSSGLIVSLALVAIVQAADGVQACGDKFLLVGRGVKFRQAYAAIYPALIVIYAQPRTAKSMLDPRLQAGLKSAGHRLTIAEDERALAHALESDAVDLVLTDVAIADRVAKQADAAPTQPIVMPVMFQPSKEEAKAIEARCNCHLTSGDRPDRYLSAIDDAMKARVAQRKKKS
jgi:hypothetical protein